MERRKGEGKKIRREGRGRGKRQREKEEGMEGGTEEEYEEGAPPRKYRWDVFLSFRGEGEDTGHRFTESLYQELVRNSIRMFRYDDDLDRGEDTLTAIEESATSIAVISKNYASSTRCLDELEKMLECQRGMMIPVFYKVDPSDVRNQKDTFEIAFRNLEQRFGEDEVMRWRNALGKAGGIKGFDSREREDSQLIQDLLKKILPKVINTAFGVAKHPVGINSRVGDLMKVLNLKSNDIRVVGLHGMGGIGKTTLATAVFYRIAALFKHSSFISNIRETSKKDNGLVSLQNKLIHDLFPNSVSLVNEVEEGSISIRERVHDKKVLFVLDDVDDVCQVNALAGRRDWFYQGSRIIITTRNKDVLREHLANEIYEVKELDSTESLQLFSYHAFGREKPAEHFMHLSEKIVSLTGQLPLALEVIGASMFYKKGKEEWKDALEKLKQIQPGNLQGMLKITYDGLGEEEQCIFLDIACLFATVEMKRESAVDIFRGCGFEAEMAINDLTAKSLIKIIDNSILWMHDQLRDMGRQIVRQERDLGKRSRLWDRNDITTVLDSEKGTREVEAITLDFEKKLVLSSEDVSKINNRRRFITSLKEKFKKSLDFEAEKDERTLYTKPFEPMLSLRLLQINYVNLEGDFKFIPSDLKWLQWKGCPLDALPFDFGTRSLAVLDLSESKIKQLWDQRRWHGQHKMAKELMVLNLLGCYNLTATPDFSGNTKLEKLILERCEELTVIHKSIGELSMLRLLNLRNCSKLKKFPNDVCGLRNLETLILSGCSNLKELPEDLSPMMSLTELLVDGTAIMKLPDSISHLKKLEKLSMENCLSLQQLPISIGGLVSLRELSLNGSSALSEIPGSIESLTNLETLSLMWCKSINAVPNSIGNLQSLLELLLDDSSIKELPESIGSLSHMKRLSVSRCRFLKKLPFSIGRLSSMVKLQLDKTLITELPDQIGTLNMVENLEMRNCESLSYLPNSIGNMSSLTILILVNGIIKELPESIGLLEKLVILRVNKCKQLSSLPSSIGKLKSLCKLQMEETSVAELPEEFGMLSSLRVLKMAKRPHLEKHQNTREHTKQTAACAKDSHTKLLVIPTSFSNLSLLYELDARSCKISGIFPDDFEKLSSLETLQLGHNNICGLPSSLRGLSVLTKLYLPYCVELKALPPLPASLIELDVTNCTALESIYDLSNLKSLQVLRLTNCEKVVDIPGLQCLKSLKELCMSGCTGCHSVVKRRLSKVALRHIQSLSIPGSQIPNWFVQEALRFSCCKNRKIKGVIICVVISLDHQIQDDPRHNPPAIVDILANVLRVNRSTPMCTTALYLLGVPKPHEDQVYLCRYSEFDRLVSSLEDGDEIQITMRNPLFLDGVQLKKYGIHPVFEDDDDNDDDDDEELLDDTQKSVSEKLSKFFNSLE